MPTFVELCAGAGGMSTGLIKSGFQPLVLVEENEDCCRTLKANHPDVLVWQKDIRAVDLSQFSDNLDLLCAGLPCQSFSLIGNRRGLEDERGCLFQYFADLVANLRPPLFLIENVPGLVSHNGGRTLQCILDMFPDEYGKRCKILKAEWHGVPQRRRRLFIVGQLDKTKEFKWPVTYWAAKLKLKHVLVDVPNSAGAQYSAWKRDLLETIPPGGNWRDLPAELLAVYMAEHGGSGGGRGGELRRLSLNEICLTLTCAPDGGATCRCHPDETRPLTIREYARVQSFEDSYVFFGSVVSQYKQIGNAVPPQLAYRIGVCLINIGL